jgi:uncharacterized protein Yka (UPF0111/DUF47 family)
MTQIYDEVQKSRSDVRRESGDKLMNAVASRPGKNTLHSHIDGLERHVEMLAEAADLLLHQLESIATPEMEEKGEDPGMALPHQSKVANRIDEVADRIGRITYSLNEMHHRVEL